MSFLVPTLSRYFFRRYMVTFVTYCLAVLFLVFLVDFNESSRRLAARRITRFSTGLFISMLRVPTVLQAVIPFVVLIAIDCTLLQLNRKYELVVTRRRACRPGSSWRRWFWPNLLIGALSITALNTFAAKALQFAEDIVVERNLGVRQTSAAAPWLRQRTEAGDTVVGARATSAAGTRLSGATFFIFDDDQRIRERLEAENAVLGDGVWELSNVKANPPLGAGGNAAISNGPDQSEGGIRWRNHSLPPRRCRFSSWGGKICNGQVIWPSSHHYEMQFHRLVAQPALLAAMTLIAAMVSLKFVRFGQSLTAILGGILAASCLMSFPS